MRLSSIRKIRDYLVSFKAQINSIQILLKFLDKLGINNLFRLINRKKLIILLYHGISKKDFKFYHRRYLPKSIFIKQITYLKKKNYKFITLTDWVKIIKINSRLKHRYVILTFDDGLKSVVDHAYPIMKKYGAKGCFYIVSDIIGNNKLLWTDYLDVFFRNYNDSKFKFLFNGQEFIYKINSELDLLKIFADIKIKLRLLPNKERIEYLNQFSLSNNINNFQNVPKDYLIVNWEELISLDREILEIGGHTKTHPLLTVLNKKDEFLKELFESKKEIEQKIGYSIKHFCFPAGNYDKTTIHYTKKHGYLTAVTIKQGLNLINSDLFQLKRIKTDNNFLIFKYKISGLYYFIQSKFSSFFYSH